MTFATVVNIVVTILCLAVLVQSVRMMRALKAMKEGALTQVVDALDRSTTEARGVLADLKVTLAGCANGQRVLAEGRDMSEELSVMIGIANATAERLVEASSSANRRPADAWDAVSDYVDVDDPSDGVADADAHGKVAA